MNISFVANDVVNDRAFHWTLNLGIHEKAKTKLIIKSNKMYREFNRIILNGYYYDKVIFDFKKGIIIITQRNYNYDAIHNLLEGVTVYSSNSISFSTSIRRRKFQ
ncbi:hypothetical protein [Lysinibacillus sp. 54212]|uniref:hypothetical protein n=1 Tax=Lysinibacillus sp. 54212 TaxID=3119829 RepID=UPI002FCA8093